MALCSINLGSEETLRGAYSWPNIPGSAETLADTILHWFAQTLQRDAVVGLAASIRIADGGYILDLDGAPDQQAACTLYAARLPVFLANGLNALANVVPKITAAGKWNPDPTNPGDVWRFFMGLGLPMINQKSLQFFHYRAAYCVRSAAGSQTAMALITPRGG